MADHRLVRVLDSLESRVTSIEELAAQSVENETQMRESLHSVNNHLAGIKELLTGISESLEQVKGDIDQLKRDANADDRSIRGLQAQLGALIDTVREYHSGSVSKFSQQDARLRVLEKSAANGGVK